MSQPKCPQCGGSSVRWNELCKKCVEKYWKDQDKGKEEKMTRVSNEEIKEILEGTEIWTNQLPLGRACVGVNQGRVMIEPGKDVTDLIGWHRLLDEYFQQEIGPNQVEG